MLGKWWPAIESPARSIHLGQGRAFLSWTGPDQAVCVPGICDGGSCCCSGDIHQGTIASRGDVSPHVVAIDREDQALAALHLAPRLQLPASVRRTRSGRLSRSYHNESRAGPAGAREMAASSKSDWIRSRTGRACCPGRRAERRRGRAGWTRTQPVSADGSV